MTKDNVFSGMRYIVQQIGEFMSSGRRVVIDFEHGQLMADERRTKFVFRSEVYAAEGVPVPAEVVKDKHVYRPSASFKPPSKQALKLKLEGKGTAKSSSRKNEGFEVPAPEDAGSLGNGAMVGTIPAEPSQATSSFMIPQVEGSHFSAPRNLPHDDDDDDEAGPEIEDADEEMELHDPAKYKGPNPKQEQAFREAMDRYLTEMEVRASEAIADKQQWEEHLERCLRQERNDIDRKRALASENQSFVQKQIDWNKTKKRYDKHEFIEAASAHEFPTFTEPADAEMRRVLKNRQMQMRTDLDLQVRTNEALKTIERNRERELEYSQMVANHNEMVNATKKEVQEKKFEKDTLTNSWAREVRMKNISKAIENHTAAGNPHASSNASAMFDFDDTQSVAGPGRSGFAGGSSAVGAGAASSLLLKK